MNLYPIALYFHILGALLLFIALALEWTVLRQVQRTVTLTQAREWFKIMPWVRRTGPWALVLIIVAGIYMMLATWGGVDWGEVAFASMFLLGGLGALNGVPLARLEKQIAAPDATPATLEPLQSPLRQTSLRTRITTALGILFLMVFKPDLTVSLLAIAIAVGIGLVSSLPAWRRNPNHPNLA